MKARGGREFIRRLGIVGMFLLMFWAGWRWSEVWRLRARNDELVQRRERLEAQLRSEQRVRVKVGAWKELPTAGGVALTRSKSLAGSEMMAGDYPESSLDLLQQRMDRSGLPGLYSPLVRQLGLNAAEAERLVAQIYERNVRWRDLQAAADRLKLRADDAAIRRERAQAMEELRGQLVGRFGAGAWVFLLEHERTLPAWELVNQFAGATALVGQPIELKQAVGLAKTLASASPPFQSGKTVDPSHVDWPKVLVESEKILTPPQQVMFRNMRPSYPLLPPKPPSETGDL